MDVVLQQGAGTVEMRIRRRSDADGVDLPDQILEIGERLYIEFRSQIPAAISALVDHRNEIKIFERSKLFCVLFSLMPDTDYRCLEFIQ